jgi:hypothetical protein
LSNCPNTSKNKILLTPDDKILINYDKNSTIKNRNNKEVRILIPHGLTSENLINEIVETLSEASDKDTPSPGPSNLEAASNLVGGLSVRGVE